MAEYLTIGGVAGSFHLNPRTLRFYDRIGLLQPSGRSESGYRLYSAADMERLKFILRAKAMGLSLAEVRSVLALSDEGQCSSVRREVGAMLARKVREMDDRIREMQELREEFARLGKEVAEKEIPCRTDAACGCLD